MNLTLVPSYSISKPSWVENWLCFRLLAFPIFLILPIIFLPLLPLCTSYLLTLLFCPQWTGDVHIFYWNHINQMIVDLVIRTICLKNDSVLVWIFLFLLLRRCLAIILSLLYLLPLSFLGFVCLLMPLARALLCWCLPILHFFFTTFLSCLVFLLFLILLPRCLYLSLYFFGQHGAIVLLAIFSFYQMLIGVSNYLYVGMCSFSPKRWSIYLVVVFVYL